LLRELAAVSGSRFGGFMHGRYQHSTSIITSVIVCICIIILVAPVSALQSSEQSVSDSLTRGSRFTITITGNPNTAYYIWLTGTSTMTGEHYDQPPIISDTAGMVKDPDGGPYTIGSYQYNNGGGKTIRDDVAPSSPVMSNTNYYGQATTDERGQVVVEFRTSVYTGLRSYSVKVENPNAPESENFQVEQTVYSRIARPMINTPVPTVPVPRTVQILTTTPTTMIPVATDTLPVITPPLRTATPSPTNKAPLTGVGIVSAIAAGAYFAGIARRLQ